VDLLLNALASPRRREILRLVRCRERSAGQIHRALGEVTFGAVSQHLGMLERAGLLCARREGRRRYYAVRPAAFHPLREWLDEMWDDALVRVKALAEAEAEAGPRRGGPGPRRKK
jgi:DNA-binding transcriptional ArsR family regulator